MHESHKICTVDLDFCQELSLCGLGFVVALLVFWEIDFCVRIFGVQSSCTKKMITGTRNATTHRHKSRRIKLSKLLGMPPTVKQYVKRLEDSIQDKINGRGFSLKTQREYFQSRNGRIEYYFDIHEVLDIGHTEARSNRY